MTYKMIHVGVGSHGSSWCRHFLPPNIADGSIEVVAAVDTNPAVLKVAQDQLGLRADQCYTDLALAFEKNRADFCTIVVPPTLHELVVDMALAHDMHILSEKPIADTLEASLRIADKVKSAGKKMGVTMSHRFDQYKTSFRRELQSGRNGALDYLVCRFSVDARHSGAYPAVYYGVPQPLMVEMAVHHMDIIADLVGAPCESLYADSWNPSWSEFTGHAQGLITMRFTNGVRAVYEAANSNAIGLNGWGQEYLRAECKDATVILNGSQLERFAYDSKANWVSKKEGEGTQLPLIQQPKWGNTWLIEQFVQWLDGGPAMETNVADNLQSVALVATAIESARTGLPVKVQTTVDTARRHIDA